MKEDTVMEIVGRALVLTGMGMWILVCGCRTQNAHDIRKIGGCGIIVRYSASQITDALIELRCEIANNGAQDIWIIDGSPDVADPNSGNQSNAGIYLDEDDRTLVVSESIGRLGQGETWAHTIARYDRLRVGRSRVKVLKADLPFYAPRGRDFYRALGRNCDYLTRLAFEIGYFTDNDLVLRKPHLHGYQSIRADESGDWITISDSTQGELCRGERAIRITIDGIDLPYRHWLKGATRELCGGNSQY